MSNKPDYRKIRESMEPSSGQDKPKQVLDSDEPTKIYAVVHEDPHETIAREKTRKKQVRKNRGFAAVTAVLLVILVLMIAVAGIGSAIAWQMVQDSPELDVRDFVNEESTIIYDSQGNTVAEIGSFLRENITYDSCPESLVDAFLSIEDSRFFTHFGFDIPRFSKAILENLKSRDFSQGGSTFTMQLVKNTYFQNDETGVQVERGIPYKVQQIYLAIKLEQLLSKKEIFQLYMNKLNFGGHVRGVQKAALYYFGKNCNELNLTESAMLAGIVNLPNRYNPYVFLDYATYRRNQVLDLMAYHGYITEEEASLSKAIKVEDQLAGDSRIASGDSRNQSYIDTVLDEVTELTGRDPTVTGMEIHTNLNQTIQTQIEAIQNSESSVVFPDDLMQVAMIVMNNQTGEIVGIGGGRNYDGGRLFNRATMGYKQPGSSVKPVLSYALAFEYLGYSLDEILLDKPITYPNESRVLVNSTGNYRGDITIKDALAYSLNIPAIITLGKVQDAIGGDRIASYMRSIGFSRVTAENFHLSFAIGGTWFETTVKELAGAHSMILNKGVYNEPHTVNKVILSDGSEYYPQNQNRRVLSSGSAWLTSQLMKNNVDGYGRGNVNWMQVLIRDYPVYAKTGTSDWGEDGIQYGIPYGAMKDKWMVSSTSQYTNAVWLGYDMAIAGAGTYFNDYKQNLNLPGQINKLLLDTEETIMTTMPAGFDRPEDVEDVTYVYGSYPHVRQEEGIDEWTLITSQVSKSGLEAQPLVSAAEYRAYIADQTAKETGNFGISATYDQYNVLRVTFAGGSDYFCTGDQRNISLHDKWDNNVDAWGACLVDLGWLVGYSSGGGYWATVYCDDSYVGDLYTDSNYYESWVADLWGQVKLCGGSTDGQASCTVAKPITVDW